MITKFVLDDPNMLICTGWLPGFCLDDLTSWKTQITTSGELTQVIHWHTEPRWADSDNPYFRDRPERDVRFAQLTGKQMEQLRNMIDALDLEGLRQLQETYGNSMDDAEEVSVVIPLNQLDLQLPVYSLEWDFGREEADCSQARQSCLQSIIQLEELVNSFAPFSTEKHFQELQAQREKDQAEDERFRSNRTWSVTVPEFLFGAVWNLGVILIGCLLCLIPIIGVYELGKTIWYLNHYESDLGEVVACELKGADNSAGYVIVVQTKAGTRLSGSWGDSRENCLRQLGKKVEVLVNPQNRQVAVLNTFIERWLSAFVILGLATVIIFLGLKRKTLF